MCVHSRTILVNDRLLIGGTLILCIGNHFVMLGRSMLAVSWYSHVSMLKALWCQEILGVHACTEFLDVLREIVYDTTEDF